MKLSKVLLFVLFLLAQFTACCGSNQKQEFEHIMDRLRTIKAIAPSDSIVKWEFDSMTDSGEYPDIDYTSTVRTGWVPQLHYYRILDMAYAYISPSSSWFKNDELYNKIVKGIEFWIAANPRSINWYQQQVDEPLSYGMILLSMRAGEKKLPESLENQIIEKWKNNGADPANFSSSNRAEISLHWLYFSCLTEDAEKLETALFYIFEPVQYSDDLGFQVDNSFLQHARQLYIGGYGEHLIESVLQAAYCVAGTRFQMPQEKLEFIRNYVLNTFAHVIRGETMNWSCSGRTITHPGYLKDQSERIPVLKKLIELDKQFEDEYTVFLNRLQGTLPPSSSVNPYHVHFYSGDYTVHVRPTYSFSTRMVSTRTARQEYMNGENLLTYYLSDGATEIKLSGNEYFDIMPFWDWNMIPGVTAPILDEIPLAPEEYTYGTSVFAGGVSDSIYGCSAYKYFDDYKGINTGASKGYFYFDDEVVCLGAGISSDHKKVVTTINQCWGMDSYFVSSSNRLDEYKGNTNSREYDVKNNWILHDGVGYYFPEQQKVEVENKTKTGNWRWISNSQEDKELSGKVFMISLIHPSFVDNGKYSYYVIPNSNVNSLSSYSTDNQIEILSNSDSAQIVRHRGLNIIECNFYKACKVKAKDVIIDAQQPCALIIKDKGSDIIIHIADPSQSRSLMSVGVQLKGMDNIKYATCDYNGIDNAYAGKTQMMIINKVPTLLENINANYKWNFSFNPISVKFDKNFKGNYSIYRYDGSMVENRYFDSNMINFNINQKGVYLIDLKIEGNSPIKKKLLIK